MNRVATINCEKHDWNDLIHDSGNTNNIAIEKLPKLHDNYHILTFCAWQEQKVGYNDLMKIIYRLFVYTY